MRGEVEATRDEAPEEGDHRSIFTLRRAVEMRLSHRHASANREPELRLRLALVHLHLEVAAGLRINRRNFLIPRKLRLSRRARVGDPRHLQIVLDVIDAQRGVDRENEFD